jgi:hypothetical protein
VPPPASSRALGPLLCVIAAVLGVVLLVLTALLGLGAVPWILGALIVLAAGVAGAVVTHLRARRHGARVVPALARGAVPAALGLAVCVAALALPGALRARENGRLVAWTAPGRSSVVLAEHGIALTLERAPGQATGLRPVVVGRDLDDGRVRWRTRLRIPDDARDGSYDDRWQRVGDVAIVAGGPFRSAALDLRTGRVLWQDLRPGLRISAVATTRAIASTRCVDTEDEDEDESATPDDAESPDGAGGSASAGPPPCTAEVRDLRTGRIRWSTPVAPQGVYLGAPTTQRNQSSGPLWPGRWVLTLAPDPRAGGRGPEWDTPSRAPKRPLDWAVRDLETGRVLRRGSTRGLTGLALAGGGLLREQSRERFTGYPRRRTTWSLVDPVTGRVRWSRTEVAGRADPGGPGTGIWLPAGRVPVAKAPFAEFDLKIEDDRTRDGGHELRLLDPRTGRLTAVRTGSADSLTFLPGPSPEVTAATVARNPDADKHVLLSVTGSSPSVSRILLATPGRPADTTAWPDDAGGNDYVATADLAARGRDHELEDLTGEEQSDAIEIRDRRTGEVVNRIRGWGSGEVRAVGERIVFDDRATDDDESVTRVLRARP